MPLSAEAASDIAARIRELAAKHSLPLREDADLAELLTALKLGEPIPTDAFAVMAEVLFQILAADRGPHAAEAQP